MIEHTTDLRWRYQVSPDDPCVIERKVNKPFARWGFYMVCDSPSKARQTLLALGAKDEDE